MTCIYDCIKLLSKHSISVYLFHFYCNLLLLNILTIQASTFAITTYATINIITVLGTLYKFQNYKKILLECYWINSVPFKLVLFSDLLMSGLFVLDYKASSADLTSWRTTCRPQMTGAIVTPATVLTAVNLTVLARSKCDCKLVACHHVLHKTNVNCFNTIIEQRCHKKYLA